MENGEKSTTTSEERLLSDLQSPEYRRAFVEGHATDTVAFQLRAMRKEKGWEQKDVAEKLGNRKLQPMISRYENPDYGKYSISTLLELAAAFDVALAVRFVPFSELARWDLSADMKKRCPPSFAEDRNMETIVTKHHALGTISNRVESSAQNESLGSAAKSLGTDNVGQGIEFSRPKESKAKVTAA